MTKEEALAILRNKSNQLRLLIANPEIEMEKFQSTVRDFIDTEGQIKALEWACKIMEQIDIPSIVKSITRPVPQNEQNSVATGWKAAITGELKQKR
jgi:hypothetical protein